MSYLKRSGNKWSINELLSLQREYELLEWNIQKIALNHSRSIESILYKLEAEGIILSWSDARGFNPTLYKKQINHIEDDEDNDSDDEYEYEEDLDVDDEEEDDDDDDDDEYIEEENISEEDIEKDVELDVDLDKLTERVWNLETSLSEIGSMVKQMFNNLVLKNNKKREPLRNNNKFIT